MKITLELPDSTQAAFINYVSWVVEGGDAHDLQDACDKAHASMADALSLIEQLERERDAAVEILRSMHCDTCIYDEHYPLPNVCLDCIEYCNWEWRGVKEE